MNIHRLENDAKRTHYPLLNEASQIYYLETEKFRSFKVLWMRADVL